MQKLSTPHFSTVMNSVQRKISCIYVTGVVDEPSNKRPQQSFKVTATRQLVNDATKDDIISLARTTEKLDGTCCFITEFKGQPCLWARHDRKPTKGSEKRFAQYKRTKMKLTSEGKTDNGEFEWNPSKDFKDVPENWIPAHGLQVENGIVKPDISGHTPGWVPVLADSRQHCWHLEVVNLSLGMALVLRQSEDGASDLLIECQPLSNLCGHTYELIGTNINGNPYNLGTKKCPFHVLVAHGGITLTCPEPTDYDAMMSWMNSDSESDRVEGIVWHCPNGQMFKLHKHHLNLRWPGKNPSLCQRKVKVQVSVESSQDKASDVQQCPKPTDLFTKLSSLNDLEFDSLWSLCQMLNDGS